MKSQMLKEPSHPGVPRTVIFKNSTDSQKSKDDSEKINKTDLGKNYQKQSANIKLKGEK